MNKLEVITLGELLIDFVPTKTGVSLAAAETFIKAPGGAPANVAVGLARLGCKSGFMGKVGADAFGHFLADRLRHEGVDVSELKYDAGALTALAFVSLGADGERDFMFYRQPSADMRHHPSEIKADYLQQAKVFHFGSISLIAEPARSATLKAVKLAQKAGALISYDPNLRLPLWDAPELARTGILSAWNEAHLIKISEEELEFLTGSTDPRAARSLFHDGLKLLLVTQGARGSYYLSPKGEGKVAGFEVNTVDTTGAGDAFTAAVLSKLSRDQSLLDDMAALEQTLRYANACAALTTTQRGAIPALPTAQELEAFLREQT